jgi:hypothetical protein
VKVVVFQWPCGTGARQRWPRGARPRRRGHLGGRSGLVDEHQALGVEVRPRVEPRFALRRDVGALLLAGVRGFFNGHGVAVEEPPDRARREAFAVLAAEQFGQFDQRHIDLRVDGGQDGVAIRLDAMRALVAALRFGALGARRAPGPNPADRARGGHAEPLGRRAARQATIDSRDQPGPEIFGQRSCHACWPPRPAGMVNQSSPASGKPFRFTGIGFRSSGHGRDDRVRYMPSANTRPIMGHGGDRGLGRLPHHVVLELMLAVPQHDEERSCSTRGENGLAA